MTAQIQAIIEQAKRLTAEERDELTSALLALDDEAEPAPPALTREERDRQIAESLAQVARGETVAEADVLAELHAL